MCAAQDPPGDASDASIEGCAAAAAVQPRSAAQVTCCDADRNRANHIQVRAICGPDRLWTPGAHTLRSGDSHDRPRIILLLIAVMNPELAAPWGVGIIALFVGMVFAVCGAIGRGVGSRRHCY